MKVGQRYYIISHAYFHYIGEVTEVIGPRTVALKNVIQIHSSQRNWTEFFKQGIKSGDRYDILPSMECTVINSFDWPHKIPTDKQ